MGGCTRLRRHNIHGPPSLGLYPSSNIATVGQGRRAEGVPLVLRTRFGFSTPRNRRQRVSERTEVGFIRYLWLLLKQRALHKYKGRFVGDGVGGFNIHISPVRDFGT